MNAFWIAVAVGCAGTVGALARFGLDSVFAGRRVKGGHQPHWPWATLIVNTVGSALLGFFFGWYSQAGLSTAVYDVVAAGLAGGLTTFSSWTVASLGLWLEGRRVAATGNLLINIVLGLGFAGLGILIAAAVI